jgi:hydrophobic/amphiphilic exporter-1 (mainly G- bacteria), HAE1 family
MSLSVASTRDLSSTTRLLERELIQSCCATVLGLLPLALGWGEGADLQAALARVVIGGLLASTFVTLFLIRLCTSR